MRKYFNYISYVIRHKWFVFIECCKRGVFWQGIFHDFSKFLPSEFFPYMQFFFGGVKSNVRPSWEIQMAFKMAWLHHKHLNPHHWQYWIDEGDDGKKTIYEMPLKYRKEMVSDWVGAGKARGKGNDVKNFWNVNKEKITLGEATRDWVEKEINCS